MSKTTKSSDHDAAEQQLSPSGLPIRAIPGSHGVPFFSPLRDRLDYYYFQGQEEYFRTRIARHGGATVLRVNMPPGLFMARDARVVAVLDARSFRILLDSSKVDKKDTIDGTFVPPFALFGGIRPLSFLDTTEAHHGTLKKMVIRLAAARKHHVIPAFHEAFTAMFDAVDAGIASSGPVEYNKLNESGTFDFTCSALFGGELPSVAIGPKASAMALKWLLFQLHPLVSKAGPLPWPIEDLLLHTFHLPPFLVRSDYAALKAYFSNVASGVLDDVQNDLGIPRDEALHNVIFTAVFNAYGGFKIFLPYLLKWLALAGPALHAKLADEVHAAVHHEHGGELTLGVIERMTLVKSVVWEALRMNPPVEFQYGRARDDLIIESHDAAYKVKKGEMIFGCQTFATRDEKVFEKGSEFVPERFATDEGRRLLEYVVWSNGPETGEPGEGNKQCPGKDMVVTVGRLLVAELFLRYDTFAADVGDMPLEPKITFKSLTKATK